MEISKFFAKKVRGNERRKGTNWIVNVLSKRGNNNKSFEWNKNAVNRNWKILKINWLKRINKIKLIKWILSTSSVIRKNYLIERLWDSIFLKWSKIMLLVIKKSKRKG